VNAAPLTYDHIKRLAAELDCQAKTLVALAPGNDPFYLLPCRQIAVEWFATEVWPLLTIDENGGVHVCRVHRVLVSLPNVRKPVGTAYENTHNIGAPWSMVPATQANSLVAARPSVPRVKALKLQRRRVDRRRAGAARVRTTMMRGASFASALRTRAGAVVAFHRRLHPRRRCANRNCFSRNHGLRRWFVPQRTRPILAIRRILEVGAAAQAVTEGGGKFNP
jgi:hypothetical protein